MGVMNLNYFWLVMFLISMDLRFLRPSPVPKLPGFLKSRYNALQADKSGQLSNGLLSKQDIEIATSSPPSALENLVDSKLPQRAASLGELKSLISQETGNLPKALTGRYAFMQLRVASQADEHKPGLKAQQNNYGLSPQLQLRRQLTDQDQANIPANPQVHSKNNEQAENFVFFPYTKPPVQSDLPLKNGMSVINLGHLDLKKDSCKAYHFKETVRHRACNSVTIDNNMCYGQCNSFYIPKRFLSCSYCAPSKVETLSVRLECPGQNPGFVVKKIPVVKECGCKDCGLEHP